MDAHKILFGLVLLYSFSIVFIYKNVAVLLAKKKYTAVILL